MTKFGYTMMCEQSWTVNADLPNPDSFDGARQVVTPEQVAESLSCGSDVDGHVQAIKTFVDAGFD